VAVKYHPKNHSPDPAKRNIELIARLEKAALHGRSTTARVSDVVARFAGTGTFIVIHIVWFAAWILFNTFDPYPFTFLTMVVSLEAIFLSIFVLISQNHMAHLADRRAHLDLQINMLAEQENTIMLHMLRKLCEERGIKLDKEDAAGSALFAKTDLKTLMKDLEEHLPDE
jgi:uncharacterized membrane protein